MAEPRLKNTALLNRFGAWRNFSNEPVIPNHFLFALKRTKTVSFKGNSIFGRYTGGPRYMQTFYLRFREYAIEIMPFQRNITSYLPMLLVSLYANSFYANHFFRSLSIAYNEVRLYYIIANSKVTWMWSQHGRLISREHSWRMLEALHCHVERVELPCIVERNKKVLYFHL